MRIGMLKAIEADVANGGIEDLQEMEAILIHVDKIKNRIR
jgi:hypothetical protein